MHAHDYKAGTLGNKLRRELEASPDFEDLMLLARVRRRRPRDAERSSARWMKR